LNNGRIDLEARGESGDTFFAMRAYAQEYRPKIIILENVLNAPWCDANVKRPKRGIDFHMKEVGYSVRYVKMDTKDFYLPHTRVRGYMICVDNDLFKEPAEIEQMLSTFEGLVKKFKRKASVPVEAMLLPADDPRVILTREELARGGRGENGRIKLVDWARCFNRHQDYRASLGLGQKHSLTEWVDGGSCTPPDYMWRGWAKGLVERVWDTIDIAYLRNLRRGFDQQYKRFV
jgi:site-specific DNA-cytosine methylase